MEFGVIFKDFHQTNRHRAVNKHHEVWYAVCPKKLVEKLILGGCWA